ncbi:MAG: LptF/LptG family permease [Rickettsiales bacterium]|nr:LptF/LptG family permease [Rickettsiales bacterium]
MKLYNRYIFYKTLLGFVSFTIIFILLIWFSRAISFVKYITENGVEVSQFLYLFVLILPWLFLFIIPISLFAATLLIYNRLITTNEITILKNAGLTKFLIAKPVLYIAIISTIFCYSISLYFMPYSNKELRISRNNFHNNYANLSINPKTFENLRNMTIYVKDRDEKNNLYGILLYDDRKNKNSATITAKSGNIVMEDNSALLYMENGTVQRFNELTKKSEILNFDNYVFNLTASQEEDKKAIWKAKERYIDELLYPDDSSSEQDMAKYRAELHQRITYPLLPIIFSLIALTCILRDNFNRRGNVGNIILATITNVVFLISIIASYDFIESSASFVPLLYCNIIISTLTCLYLICRTSK